MQTLNGKKSPIFIHKSPHEDSLVTADESPRNPASNICWTRKIVFRYGIEHGHSRVITDGSELAFRVLAAVVSTNRALVEDALSTQLAWLTWPTPNSPTA